MLCKSILLGGVKTVFKSNHKLADGLFPILYWHRPTFRDIA